MLNLEKLFEQGQGILYDAVKKSIFNADEIIFKNLEFENDYNFSEPFLFSYFTLSQNDLSLNQILYGYIENRKRPREIWVKSDKRGRVYLPNYGCLHTNYPTCNLILKTEENKISLLQNDININFSSSPILHINLGKRIELSSNIDSLSEKLFHEWNNKLSNEEMESFLMENKVDLEFFKPLIEKSLEIIRDFLPYEFEKYISSTRRIILFEHPMMRNFVSKKSHGTIFLNVNRDSGVPFFLEELIHQCSHTVFNAITVNTEDFFKVNPQSLLGDFIDKEDNRTLYSALHGIYTTGKIVDSFIKLLESDLDIDADTKFEIIGRLSLNKNRVNIGLERAPLDDIFTKKGKTLFNYLNNLLVRNIENHSKYFNFDLIDHPVVFSYKKFKQDNPLELYRDEFSI